jgi:pimeloyl-ACP methyl ester carboxylesterase
MAVGAGFASPGGMVIAGVADRAASAIAALVYLDAFVPEDGQAMHDMGVPERRARTREVVEEKGEGWWVPPRRAESFQVAAPADPGWDYFDVDCGHDVMVDRPDELAEILMRLPGG